jgi:hypothetical protein
MGTAAINVLGVRYTSGNSKGRYARARSVALCRGM